MSNRAVVASSARARPAKARTASTKFVAFGELLVRLDTKDHERFVQAETLGAHYTGGEANVAAALSQWGVETFAVSKVPAHEIGQACLNHMRRFGINTDFVVRGGPRLGILYVETGASQRAGKVIYDREHSSFRGMRLSEVDWKAVLLGKDWLHFTGTAPALGPNVLAVLKAGLHEARRRRVTVSFDCNYRSTLWSVKRARRILRDLMPLVDVFVGTHHDARALFDIDAEPAASALQMKKRFGFRRVAYTLRRGASASVNHFAGLLCDGPRCRTSREYEMHVIDRIGGGDAFSAGLIYGLLTGWPSQRTIEFAAAAACLKHSIPQDFNLVTLEEVEQLVAGGESGQIRR
jgi:2-dehydro-3-deoxygluconokinase